jgi:hypothetical protein
MASRSSSTARSPPSKSWRTTVTARDGKMPLTKFASKWFRWGESVELEFDTEKGTAEVKVVKQR